MLRCISVSTKKKRSRARAMRQGHAKDRWKQGYYLQVVLECVAGSVVAGVGGRCSVEGGLGRRQSEFAGCSRGVM